MPDDGDLNKILDNYGTFGKQTQGQKEPVAERSSDGRPGAAPKQDKAKSLFDKAGDWLNSFNQKKASPKPIMRPKPAPAPKPIEYWTPPPPKPIKYAPGTSPAELDAAEKAKRKQTVAKAQRFIEEPRPLMKDDMKQYPIPYEKQWPGPPKPKNRGTK